MAAQKLPEAKLLEEPCDDGKTEYFLGHGYHICSWRPGPPRSGPPTEVHLLVEMAPEVKMVFRLKSARALDELVGLLLEYRNEVWPNTTSSQKD